MNAAYDKLKDLLSTMGGALIAFSGGVDSSVLLAAAHDALGSRALAATGISPTFPAHDYQSAQRIASQLGARWITIETNELDDPHFSSNPENRCYYCKKRLFSLLIEKAHQEKLAYVIEGSNRDDLSDYRPGLLATRELEVRSPFVELGLGKKEIRQMAKDRGLENWARPSSACLSSRIPYGEQITRERLDRIARSEALLREMGFRQVRVRDHGILARIELPPEDLNRMLDSELRDTVVNGCKAAGYTFVTLDLQGYRTGAMNETL
jgi:pyridinium-3,5-biscarboxylic acid mononucleotide sulfurtransferase